MDADDVFDVREVPVAGVGGVRHARILSISEEIFSPMNERHVRSLAPSCVHDFDPSGWVVLSERNEKYLTWKAISLQSNSSCVVWVSVFAKARSTLPASVTGLMVTFLTTICFMWNWHIWNGIPSKTLGNPRNPSDVTESILYPSLSRNSFPSL